MKTVKFVLIITMLSLATLIYADSQPGSGLIKISIGKAIQNPELTKAIYNQVDATSFLSYEKEGYYVARVIFNQRVYAVYGTYDEWVNFFLMDLQSNKKIKTNRHR
jgi:hypothetical protein